MATASIYFEDSDEGVTVRLQFDDPLPDDPADASDAQVEAMLLFTSIVADVDPSMFEDDIPHHPDFDDGESEEAGREV